MADDAGDAVTVASPDRRGGGTGIAGGTDLHAMALVLAAIALMRGSKLGWLEKVAKDVPVAVTAETGGPGDDIALELEDGTRIEVQSKKGLQRGGELWTALENLIDGVSSGAIAQGVLIVSSDSSGSIRKDLADDLVLIGQGQTGTLSDIGNAWLQRMRASGRDPDACAHVRIKTLFLLDGDGGDRRTALMGLEGICTHPERAGHALAHLYHDAVALQKSRGRWTLPTLVRLLRSHGIEVREDGTPIGLAAKLADWARTVNRDFRLPAGIQAIPIEEMLPGVAVATSADPEIGETASVALERYHKGEVKALDVNIYEGAWLGRFRRLAVIVAGPGLGKSTLARRLAWENARDGIPVLLVPLAAVAKAMRNGVSFEQALWDHGLDGSGVAPARAREAFRGQVVVVADGLDEARELRDQVAAGLVRFANGAPDATVIVTTRPIGYETARLANWRHYRLQRPDTKEGPKNLGRLVALGRGLPGDDADSLSLAKVALAATPAAEVIGASPLLLGMAASLLIRDQRLPRTRPKLYEAMIGLFETRDALGTDLAGFLVTRVLDIVGWQLVHNPNQDLRQLERAACGILATDLGTTPMAAASQFVAGFDHWACAGVVECLQFGTDQLISFTHRTFAEFAAARYLVEMGPARKATLDWMVDDATFAEVVSFAGALGLGDEIAQLFFDRRDSGAEGQFERALELAGDRDAAVADQKVVELVNGAFDVLASGSADRFPIGVALADLAARKRSLVAPPALARIADPNDAVRLAAAACVARAVSGRLDATEWTDLLDDLAQRIVPTRISPGSGIRAMRTGTDVDLLDIVALAALEAQPVAAMDGFSVSRLSGNNFDRWGFQLKVDAILAANGLKKLDDRWKRYGASTASMIAMLAPDRAWNIAANKATSALAAAVAAPEKAEGSVSIACLPQFSALHQLAGVGESVAPDVHKWTAAYDEEAVWEVIRALVSLSRIDPVALRAEGRAVLDTLAHDPDRSPFLAGLRPVDIPEPEWSRTTALGLDRTWVETSFHHGSSWLRLIAANLLANMPADRGDHVRLLNRSRGDELYYASVVVAARATREDWRVLVLERASSGSPRGIQHLLDPVIKSAGGLPPQTGAAVEAGLRSGIAAVVEAAAKLGTRWVGEGGALDAGVLDGGYRATLGRETGEGGTTYPASATVATLELLAVAGLLEGELLDLALVDPRDGPRAVAHRALAAETDEATGA